MEKIRFFSCTILFFCACTLVSNARIGMCYTENCVEYCDELVVCATDFVRKEVTDTAINYVPMNLQDSLVEGETYRIKITRFMGGGDTPLYSYNIYATYTCDLDLGSEDLELLDYIDYGSLVDENGNGLRNIAGSIPYNEDDIMGDYEQDEYAAMIYQYGLHFISVDDVNTYPIKIEVYRMGEEDEPW